VPHPFAVCAKGVGRGEACGASLSRYALTIINPPSYNFLMITVSKEDYLKSILEAESEGEAVIAARLADLLSVSPPAVTMALRRLKKDGLVSVQPSGEIRLTADGRKIARKLTLRHHLIERMLSEMFGMEWWKVHDEAERLEHAVPRLRSQTPGEAGLRRQMSPRQSQRTRRPRQPPPPRPRPPCRRRTRQLLHRQRNLRTRPPAPRIPRTPRRPPRCKTPPAGTQLRSDLDSLHARRNRLIRPRRL
jgi:Mn-dependent DtxR family transcriptional regulator